MALCSCTQVAVECEALEESRTDVCRCHLKVHTWVGNHNHNHNHHRDMYFTSRSFSIFSLQHAYRQQCKMDDSALRTKATLLFGRKKEISSAPPTLKLTSG